MLDIHPVAPGCIIVRGPSLDIMFGAPSDVVKLLIRKNLPVPYHVVLSPSFFKFGLCQASVEFPLYYHLFVRNSSEKFTLIGDRDTIDRQYSILQQTLIGPTHEQMSHWGIEKAVQERMHRYHTYFQSTIMSVNDIVTSRHFEDDEVTIKDMTIKRIDESTFEVIHGAYRVTIDMSVKTRPTPYLTFPPISQPIKPMRLGFINVGSSSGFDPNGDTSSLIIFSNYLGISIDGSPWLRERLQSLGISMDHIRLFVITHEKLINFIELIPGKTRKWFGIEFEAHETFHPIPTIGVKIERRILVSGDTVWGKQLDEAYQKGVIDKKSYEKLTMLPLDREAEIIFMDAGGGDVHADPGELAELPEEQKMKIIITHTSATDSNIQLHHLQSSWFGHYRILDGENFFTPIDALSLFYSPILAEAHPNWVKVFMSRGVIKQYGPNQIILAEGTVSTCFYIILNGTVRVIKGKQLITFAQAGEFIGEIASGQSDYRHSSSIISVSPVEILEIDSTLFQEFLHDEGLKERFQKLGEIRPILFQTTMFKNIPERILQKIIDTTFVREYPPGVSIVKQGDPADAFYLILDGSCEVIMEIDGSPREIGMLNRNDVFGEIGLLEDVLRTASIHSITPVKALVLKKQDFEEIVEKVPGITYQLLMQAKKRRTQDQQRTAE